MTDYQHKIRVRTLGDFSLHHASGPVAVNWPDMETKMLFCSLLSPLDVSIPRERLCRSLWNIRATDAGNQRLMPALKKLHEVMADSFGHSPVIAWADGIALDFGRVDVDAHDFHETTINGLRQLAAGNRPAAHRFFQQAATLYRGAFLPGMTNRIITATRTELEQQHQLLASQLWPMPPRPGMTSRPEAFFCAP